MTRGEIQQLPIWMPGGNNRNWMKADGVATIDDQGEVHIRFYDPKHSEMLVEFAQERVLLQVAFDFRMDEKTIERINKKYEKTDTEKRAEKAHGNITGSEGA